MNNILPAEKSANQLQEKINTLTQQKHALEQTNIALEREFNRSEDEVARLKRVVSQISDQLDGMEVAANAAISDLETLREDVWKLVRKYLLD